MSILLSVHALHISSQGKSIVSNVSFEVVRGTALTLAGESGSGKTLVGHAVSGTLSKNVQAAGEVLYDGLSLLDGVVAKRLWGRRIFFIPQEPLLALDPTLSIESQVADVLRYTKRFSPSAAHDAARRSLAGLGIDAAAARLHPHRLSGGMRQRALIAMALISDAELIVFDEPTKGLDAPLRNHIAQSIEELLRQGKTLLCVTHDFTFPQTLGGAIAIMRRGTIVEAGSVASVLQAPQHPYTRELLASLPENGLTVPDTLP